MRHFFSLAILVAVALAQDAVATDLALTHARIYAAPDADPVADGTLLIHDGRIRHMGPAGAVKLPTTTRVIDLRGAVVTAGFWNSHVHLLMPSLLNADTHSNAELSQALTQC